MNYAKYIREKHFTGAGAISALVLFTGAFAVPPHTVARDWAVWDGEGQIPELRRIGEDPEVYRLRLLARGNNPYYKRLLAKAAETGLSEAERESIRDATPLRRQA